MDLVNETGLEAAWMVVKTDPPRSSLITVVKGTFRLRHEEAAVLAEEQLSPAGDQFESDDPARPLRYPMDFAPFKPRADALLVGTCHAPGGTPVSMARVSFGVGERVKSLIVFGDRQWTRGDVATEPVPFVSLPLSWERAFGGPDFAHNPFGRGVERAAGGRPGQPQLLPNIESADRLLRSRTDAPQPAGFGPVPDSWPQRLRKWGTFDDQYLETRWPAPPSNTDWSFFNAAPEDQQLATFLNGDEELFMEHLHPTIPQYRSRLPGLRVRCFLNERARAECRLREIPMRLDTSFVDMDSELLVLVWRGHLDVRSPKLIDVEHLFVMSEPLEHPPAELDECERHLELVLAHGLIEDEDLEAEDEPEDTADADEDDDGDEDDGGGRAQGPAASAESADAGETIDAPPDEAPLTLARVQQMATAGASFAGCDLSALDLTGLDLSGLDFREAILERANMTGANLSQANFAGATLTGANLREARCAGTIFTEADFSECWLTHADLSGADLREADFSKARLALADLRDANAADTIFTEADLSDAILAGATLAAADFSDARLHRADFSQANLAEAAFERAWGRHVKAVGASLLKARGAEALLCEADLRQSVADEAVWESADLFRARFDGASLNESDFSGARLEEASFDATELQRARLNEATMRRAHMSRCNLLEASLDEADLTDAVLDESNLFGATLADAVLDGARFAGANLRRLKSREEIG